MFGIVLEQSIDIDRDVSDTIIHSDSPIIIYLVFMLYIIFVTHFILYVVLQQYRRFFTLPTRSYGGGGKDKPW